ncbi:hypothetical protein [Algoriphagus sp.]|uniref:hypothetical protein n=1 Tax=Algoriphagus sp. TaxID=1872435 RepID=UPI003F7058E5
MDQFIMELKNLLKNTLILSGEFKKGNRDFSFDIDNEVYKISIKYNKDFEKGDLNLLYNLLDFYCDAIKHGFKEVVKNYPVLKAQSDIETIRIVLRGCSELVLPNEIKERLISI